MVTERHLRDLVMLEYGLSVGASLHKWEQQLLSPGHKLESTCHQE